MPHPRLTALLSLISIGALSCAERLVAVDPDLPPPKLIPGATASPATTPSTSAAPFVAPPALYPVADVLPIDLPTALRLADAQNPAVALARARVQELLARQDQADVLWLPSFGVGTTYLRSDGQTQNQRGEIFAVSRSNLFPQFASSARVEISDAYFLPLVARRLTAAERAQVRAIENNVQLESALAYLDLLQAHAALAVNRAVLQRVEQMRSTAKAADEAGIARNRADVNRAEVEYSVRVTERRDLEGRAGVASARLVRVLLLNPGTELVPADPAVVPITLVPGGMTQEDLVLTAWTQRPELTSQREQILAAQQRVRQARTAPLLPRVQMDYQGGVFGGGRNDYVGNFEGRSFVTAGVVWEVRNLGFGTAATVRERQATLAQANLRATEVQAQVAAEVIAAARNAGARHAALDSAQTAVKQAREMYRKLVDTSFGVVGPQSKFDALEPLTAIQAHAQARTLYLNAVIEYNRAQFQLYTALGQPPETALPTATPIPVEIPVLPNSAPPPLPPGVGNANRDGKPK